MIGRLYVNVIRGEESYSFEYDSEWLNKKNSDIYMDPRLIAFTGRKFPAEKGIFGLFADASPDRWGRMLMNKRERLLAHKESCKPQKLNDSDYLLVVYDEGRMGDLSSLKNHLDLAVRRIIQCF